MITAYSYVRFSSPAQAAGNSKARQTEYAQKLAERYGWHLDNNLTIDDLGRSGFAAGKQKGLAVFLEAIKAKKIKKGSVLILERLDRLSRQNVDAARELCRQILLAGVNIATYSPERIYDRQSVDEPMALIEMILAFKLANDESKKKSERTADNFKRARAAAIAEKKPITTRRPCWIDIERSKTGYAFKLNHDKAAVIRKIFKMATEGLGERTIANRLNRSGIENIAYKSKRTARKNWNQSFIRSLLSSESTYGRFQPFKFDENRQRKPDGEPINGYYPAAIDEKTFWAARGDRAKRHKKSGRTPKDMVSLFSGILYDARTKTTMRLANSSQCEKKNGCYRRLTSWHCGISQSWQYEHFESGFLQFVKELDPQELSNEREESKIPELTGKLTAVNEKIADIEEQLLGETTTFKSLASVLKRLETQREELQAEIENEQTRLESTDSAAIEELKTVAELLNSVSSEQREDLRTKLRNHIRSIVSEIWLLVEETKLKKRLKTCTVQVFFADGTFRQFTLIRYGKIILSIGNRATPGYRLNQIKASLKTWDGKPLYEWDDTIEATIEAIARNQS